VLEEGVHFLLASRLVSYRYVKYNIPFAAFKANLDAQGRSPD
jgi:hypothetical protein